MCWTTSSPCCRCRAPCGARGFKRDDVGRRVVGHRLVTPEQLELHNAEVPTTLTGELEVEERRIVQEALVKASGSRTEAAKILGVPRTTLVNKIRRFGL